ncbi:MAG: alpha/beta hydrolase [Oscillospiraceae bacterium]
MAIKKFMAGAIKALSRFTIDVKKDYKIDRWVTQATHPSIKSLYNIWDHKILVGDYEVPVRIFIPKKQTSLDIILYFHGGGWVSGDLNTYTKTCAILAETTGRRVISIDYRRAPEFPFPYAVNDCYKATLEIFLNRGLLDAEDSDIILAGDSAGGNLAAVVSLIAAERHDFQIKKQILIYPATFNDHSSSSPFPSIIENGTDYLMTSEKIRDYMTLYVQNKEDLESPYFAPLLAKDLSDQPKTLIITAEYDPLRDEGEAYGEKLKSFGNSVEVHRVLGAIHGFFSLAIKTPQVTEAYGYINSFLNEV